MEQRLKINKQTNHFQNLWSNYKNFPTIMPDTKPQMQEVQRTLSRINAKDHILAYHFQTAESQR